MPRRAILLLGILLLPPTLTLAGVITSVTQQGRAFLTRTVSISRGDTVRFVNVDDFVHQIYVEAPAFSFESDEQPPGQTVDVRFTAAGTFQVRCHIHPKMLLQVEVH